MTGIRRAGLLVVAAALLGAGGILLSRGLRDEGVPVVTRPAAGAPLPTPTTAPPTTAPPATAAGPTTEPPRRLGPPAFLFPNGTTVDAALVREMAVLRDFSYLEGILGGYGIEVRVTETTSSTAGAVPEVQASFPPTATFEDGRLRVSEDLRGTTVEIDVVRRG